MKKSLLLTLLFLSFSVQTSHAALIDNVVSYWKMDEASGTREDIHGVNDLTDNNTVAAGTGIINNGSDFEASNSESLSIADGSQTGLDLASDFSFSFWVNPETIGASQGLLTKFRDAAGNKSYRLHFTTTQYFLVLTADGSTETQVGWTHSMSTATWYHFVLVYDASAGSAELYRNGSSLGSQGGLSTSIFNSGSTFRLGARSSSVDAAEQFLDGILDEVGIWSRTLDSSEVTALYNAGAGFSYPFAVDSPAIFQSIFWFD